MLKLPTASLGIIIYLGVSAATDAAIVTQSTGATPTTFCQPARNVYERNIRNRPLAIQNEGHESVFITCSLPGEVSATSTTYVRMGVINNSDQEASITCTLVSGLPPLPVTYIPRTSTLGPGEQGMLLNWRPEVEGEGQNFSIYVSLSCLLAPGTGISFIYASREVQTAG